MKKLLSISLILFCVLSISAQVVDQAAKKSTAPVIAFEEMIHDFGTIDKGVDGSFEFKFTNTGKEDLVVTNARTSCGCTVAQYTKDPVAKKQSGIIKVKYDTNRVGPFEKTITVESNSEGGSVVLRIKGNVIQPVQEAVPANDQQSPIKNN